MAYDVVWRLLSVPSMHYSNPISPVVFEGVTCVRCIYQVDTIGNIEFYGYQSCMTAMRMLVYGSTANLWDEHLWVFESTCREVMVRFGTIMFKVFEAKYLRTKYCNHNKDHDTWRMKRISRYARIPGLHMLEMEKLPICSTGAKSSPSFLKHAVTSQDL